MPLTELDHAAIARTLAQIADRRGDLADAFFEESEVVELPPDGAAPGLRVWREEGLAIRLLRRGRTWIAARDGISASAFSQAIRQVARAMPRAPYPEPRFTRHGFQEPIEAPELLDFPAALARAIRSHHVTFPMKLTVRRHRRNVRIVGTQLSSGVERESFFSVHVEMPWGRFGQLLPELGEEAPEALALQLVHSYRAHKAPPPAPASRCVLGPSACAVLLHEAVAHALEADTLALSGDPEAAVGVALGTPEISVFDDPSTAPASVRRRADDEGHPVSRRCLLREGKIEQPLADTLWARQSDILRAGSGRRSSRHLPPGPRSWHLELIPGKASREELFAAAGDGLYLPETDRGHMDPISGELLLHFPYGYLLKDGVAGPPVGRSSLRLHVSDVLQAVRGVGREPIPAGAGWCAKGGMKLPVWATAPELLLVDLPIEGDSGASE